MADPAPYNAPAQPAAPEKKPVTLAELDAMRARGEPITMLTCYDASFAALLARAGVDTILIGDSLGMVIQGHSGTAKVTLEDIAYHTAAVVRGAPRALVIADMPWNTYHGSPAQAFDSAARLVAAGAQMVKMEGGEWLVPTTRFLAERGIPVCSHLGLLPQTVASAGGYRVQGRDPAGAERIVNEARAHAEAGARMVLMEMIPDSLARRVTEAVSVPTIGIGAGPHVSGQVLVLYDILDVFPGKKARFVKNYLAATGNIEAAVRAYVSEVKAGAYPAKEHSFGG